MDFGLKDKTALVLGAGGGLGSAIAVALAREGVRVALGDISGEALANTQARLDEIGAQSLPITWNLADLAAIDTHIAAVEEKLGPIDVLVNNTSGPPPTLASGQDAAFWSKHFNDMVLSVIKITDRILPGMRERGWGRIITSTSSGVVTPIPNLAVSNALRLSLVGWSKTLSREVARDGITVNIVLPGRIATGRIRFLDEQKAKREGRDVAAVAADSVASIPAGRYGEPEEYADVVTFLASARASYLTGSIIRVDGGLIPSI